MAYDPRKHHRRSIRLKGYDYAKEGLYFITICTWHRQAYIFGAIENGQMHLNAFGKIAHEEWENSLTLRTNISLGAFIIMPNHMHGIIQIDKATDGNPANLGKFHSPSQTIGAIIRGYKGATTRRIRAYLAEENPRTGELHSPPPESHKESKSEKQKNLHSPQPPLFLPNGLSLPEGSIWKRDYYENIIRNEKAYANITHYIENNLAKWTADRFLS